MKKGNDMELLDMVLLDSDVIKKEIMEHLKRYSAIASLPGSESLMWEIVKNDFQPRNDMERLREVKVDGKIKYGALYSTEIPGKYTTMENRQIIWIVHLDRVSGPGGLPYTNTIIDYDDYVMGQLDDIIGIAILKAVFDMQVPLNIMFTTEEETVKSVPQIIEFLKLPDNEDMYVPVTIDIDVFEDIADIEEMGPTIRNYDNNAHFDLTTVTFLRNVAAEQVIEYETSAGYAIVETGFLSHATQGELTGAHLGIPITNYHTDRECAFWNTIHDVVKLVYRASDIRKP